MGLRAIRFAVYNRVQARLDAVERRLLALEGEIVQLEDLGFHERRIDDLETAVYGSHTPFILCLSICICVLRVCFGPHIATWPHLRIAV